MSLILEALRKSEAERRRGEAPGLRVELPPPVSPKARLSPWAWAAAGALLAALLLLVLWPRGGGQDAGAGQDTDRDAAGTTQPATSTGSDDAAGDRAASSGGVATGPSTAAATAGFPSVERIEAANAAPAPEPAPDLPLAPPPMAVRAAEEAADLASGGPAAPHAGAADEALRITGLSASQRERLPALKLSLHMWNDDPARRFAVIDGQRRVEGDRLGDATITAIDRDGVLLDLDGQAVRVPLP